MIDDARTAAVVVASLLSCPVKQWHSRLRLGLHQVQRAMSCSKHVVLFVLPCRLNLRILPGLGLSLCAAMGKKIFPIGHVVPDGSLEQQLPAVDAFVFAVLAYIYKYVQYMS